MLNKHQSCELLIKPKRLIKKLQMQLALNVSIQSKKYQIDDSAQPIVN